MIILTKDFRDIDLKDYTLIIPSISVGNIGQLVVDLIITTLNLPRIGFIRHRNILPVAGVSNNGQGVATECEIFASTVLKIAVIQIRSTYGPFATISPFLSELCKSVSAVVILTGSYAYERKNIHLVEEPIRYLFCNGSSTQKLLSFPKFWKEMDVSTPADKRIAIPGSGIADHLFHQCKQEGIPTVIIIMYLSEGDNRGDAFNMADYLDSWLGLRKGLQSPKTSWESPSSWDNLFGNSFPVEIF